MSQTQGQTQGQQQLIAQYIGELSPLELQAYEIARSHLNTSFNIVRSNGFVEWMKNRRQQGQQDGQTQGQQQGQQGQQDGRTQGQQQGQQLTP